MLHEAFDRATFACCIPTFENNNYALAAVFYPVLDFQKFNLKLLFTRLILFSAHASLVGIVFRQSRTVAFRNGALMQQERWTFVYRRMVNGLDGHCVAGLWR